MKWFCKLSHHYKVNIIIRHLLTRLWCHNIKFMHFWNWNIFTRGRWVTVILCKPYDDPCTGNFSISPLSPSKNKSRWELASNKTFARIEQTQRDLPLFNISLQIQETIGVASRFGELDELKELEELHRFSNYLRKSVFSGLISQRANWGLYCIKTVD